jgi:hypothetical protein
MHFLIDWPVDSITNPQYELSAGRQAPAKARFEHALSMIEHSFHSR